MYMKKYTKRNKRRRRQSRRRTRGGAMFSWIQKNDLKNKIKKSLIIQLKHVYALLSMPLEKNGYHKDRIIGDEPPGNSDKKKHVEDYIKGYKILVEDKKLDNDKEKALLNELEHLIILCNLYQIEKEYQTPDNEYVFNLLDYFLTNKEEIKNRIKLLIYFAQLNRKNLDYLYILPEDNPKNITLEWATTYSKTLLKNDNL